MDRLNVLVVEDDETTRRALVRMLARDERVQALGAEDGLAALRVLEAQPIDVVISDEVMPRINGLRLLEAIKGRWPGTRRVLYTGHLNADVVINAINRGGVDKALSKGMLPEQFRAEVDELIEECLAGRIGAARAGAAAPRTEATAPGGKPTTALVIGDELAVRHAIEGALRAQGFTVQAADSTQIESGMKEGIEVVVLDLSSPGTSPVEAMRRIRERDLDCPVVVLSSRREVERAHEAVRLGAHRYLVHPVPRDALAQTARKAATLNRLSRARQQAVAATRGAEGGLGDRAGLEVRFERALGKLYMVYQPIVSWSEKRVIGFEALMRSEEPSMPHPGLLLDAASRLERMPQLSAAIRRIAHKPLLDRHDDVSLFLNLHVSDVSSADLLEGELSEMASRIVLEITERASLESVDGLDRHIAALRARGYRIAIDDLGAGYAGLSSFALLDPHMVKLDMSLVRDVHESPVKRRLVESLQEACADLGVPMVAEGVESAQERDALLAAGCDLFQGYFFARPARELPEVHWG